MNKHFQIITIVLTGLIYMMLITASVAGTGEREEINFLPMWIPQPQFAGYYMAKEKGIYETHGLSVTILDGGSKKNVVSMLKQGSIHFGIMNLLTAIIEKSKGTKIINAGQIFQKGALEFVARKESGISTLADFNGKKIAVWRSVLRAQTDGFLNIHGIHADIYPVNDGLNLFLKKVVDICPVMHFNEYNTLINHGINPEELVIFNLANYNMGFPEDGIYCMEDTFMENPDFVRSFVKASMEGWEYAIEHPGETVDVIQKIRLNKNIKGNTSHLAWMMNNMGEMIHPKGKNTPPGHLSEADYNHAVAFLLQTGQITQKVSYDQFYIGNR